MKLIKRKILLILFIQFTFIGYTQSNNLETLKNKRTKIDGVAAVVGDYVILESDVDKTLIDLQSQGLSTKNIGRCSLLGKLMEDKLYAHHAEQDSLEVDNNQIYSYVDRTIDYFVDTTPNKIGKFMPGSRLYIKKYSKASIKQADYIFLGAWNFKKEIFKKESKFIKKGGKFITHVPYPRII